MLNSSPRTPKVLSYLFSYALAGILLVSLILYSGIWDFLANTRILSLFIDGGVVAYHDGQLGLIDGLPSLGYYLKAIEPIEWHLVAVVFAIFWFFFALKGVQVAILARSYGIQGTVGQFARAFFRGSLYEKFLPYRSGEEATTQSLLLLGAEEGVARHIGRMGQVLVAFEILTFSFIGLLVVGWGTWLSQTFWALVILSVIYFLFRRSGAEGESLLDTAKEGFAHLSTKPKVLAAVALLSLMAFGVEDLAAYFTAMSFSGEEVILHASFDMLLMGVVASYVARFIPLTPGGIGQFEWGFAAALYLGGLGMPEAAAIAILDNAFRYASFILLYLISSIREFKAPDPAAIIAAIPTPDPGLLWRRGLWLMSAVGVVFAIDRLSALLFDYWLFESMELSSVFDTNFNMGLLLFVAGALGMFVNVAVPAFVHPVSPRLRGAMIHAAVLMAGVGGYLLAMEYSEFLTVTTDDIGQVDPVFGRDISFYMFVLDGVLVAWMAALASAIAGLGAAALAAYFTRIDQAREGMSALARTFGAMASPATRLQILMVGLLSAIGVWLSRFDLLFKDNVDRSIEVGASYVDVEGLFSNLHYINITTLVVLGLTAIAFLGARQLSDSLEGKSLRGPGRAQLLKVAMVLLLVDFSFKTIVEIRQSLFVTPNEPVVQLPYIDRHVQATRVAFSMDEIEERSFTPKGVGDPLPQLSTLMAHPAIRNIPLWPGFTSRLERHLDLQHGKRIIQTGGDDVIYGPTLDIFRQEQKLRTYYNFLGTDTVRYSINGEKRLFVSAARELPLFEPVPWLAYFGQRYMLFTHGLGMVISPAWEMTASGSPTYALGAIPSVSPYPSMKLDHPNIYYGEGAATMAFSNVDGVAELDYPTDQDRATLPNAGEVGVAVDSLLKRLVLGWRSGQFFEMVMSGLITESTRIHYYRTPLTRLSRFAPFVYLDSNPYAVVDDGRMVWITNGLTVSDRYPYSAYVEMGDKSDERGFEPREEWNVNYAEDTIKATVDAETGKVTFYRIGSGPVIDTWASVYPDLFTDESEMSPGIRSQMTYPTHLYHAQFDDLYIYYHMEDPMYYFNQEDMWDDADEVLGAIMDEGQAITFSMEPYQVLQRTGGALPDSSEAIQYTLMMPFTPEKALNLRSIALAYQDGEDYGKLAVLQVPKGHYTISPEQADAAIDQDPAISQQISWWNRRGTEVIRGHTSLIIAEGEVIYVEPMFLRSKQNPVTQLKKVAVVFRGTPRLGDTLEEALEAAIDAHRPKVARLDHTQGPSLGAPAPRDVPFPGEIPPPTPGDGPAQAPTGVSP